MNLTPMPDPIGSQGIVAYGSGNEVDEDPLVIVSKVRERERIAGGCRPTVVEVVYSLSAKAMWVVICDTVSLFHAAPIETRRIMIWGESVCPIDDVSSCYKEKNRDAFEDEKNADDRKKGTHAEWSPDIREKELLRHALRE